MTAGIPVFVSAPSLLSDAQVRSFEFIQTTLESEGLIPRALGRSDYGVNSPMGEVYSIASHCAGGIILGFTQVVAAGIAIKPGTIHETSASDCRFPSPWNNLEAGILFGLKKPLLVFRENGIEGGVFDNGASEVFVQSLPGDVPTEQEGEVIGSVIKTWASSVRHNYRLY